MLLLPPTFNSIIYDYKNVFISYIYAYWLNWPHKIKSPFQNWFVWKTHDQPLLEILSFATNHYATGMQLVVICNYKFSIV
jgi:hypothetical protein